MLGNNRRSSSVRRTADARRAKRGRTARIVTIAASLVIVLIAAAYTVGSTQAIASQLTIMQRTEVFPDESLRPAPAQPVSTSDKAAADGGRNILLLGSDARREVASLDEADGNRADTIIVVNIPADGADVTVMSIMRDSWVTIPEHGEAKINAALSIGGVPRMVQTVEEFIGARIDNVALVDFEGLRDLTDALGGVTVYNSVPFTSTHGGHSFAGGSVTLSGDEALGYVRERYAFSDGDYQRVRNQQAFLRGILHEVDGVVDPVRILHVATSLAPYVAVDDGFSMSELVDLFVRLRQAEGHVRFFTSPTLGTDTVGDQSIVRVDWAAMDAVRRSFTTDPANESATALITNGRNSQLPATSRDAEEWLRAPGQQKTAG